MTGCTDESPSLFADGCLWVGAALLVTAIAHWIVYAFVCGPNDCQFIGFTDVPVFVVAVSIAIGRIMRARRKNTP